MNPNPQRLAVAAMALLAASSLHADWKYAANRYDLRTATTTATGISPDGPLKATLTVQYSPAKNGALSIDFIVAGANQMKGFGFEAFEGPDAPAANRKLTRIVVEKPGTKPLTLPVKVAGWYLDDTFHFSANGKTSTPRMS